MALMTATDDLRRSIEVRLSELEQEASLLRDALQALDGSSSPTRTRRTPTMRQAQPTEVVPAGKLEKLLAKTDENGITTANLAKEANADADQVLELLRELERDGKARRTGQRRGTRWHAITEDS
jgi:predicted Rossmann fold nucleotide-binding protein DprA/Smf involved in DNA uptake